MTWGGDDIRIVGDIVVGSLLANGLRLIVVKAFIEPAAVAAGRWSYRRADAAAGDRLPDLFPPPTTNEPHRLD
jgi:hypothetical protein